VIDVSYLRFQNLQAKCGGKDNTLGKSTNFDLASLPLCRSALQQLINQSNYQVGIWKCAHIAKPSVPKPDDGNGWTLKTV
jgi:hypothetical protein